MSKQTVMNYTRLAKTRFPAPPHRECTGFPREISGHESLVSLNGFWLECVCPGCQIVEMSLQLLCARHGWEVEIADVVDRLKCSKCGRRPATVDLVDDPSQGAHGVPFARPKKTIALRVSGTDGAGDMKSSEL